MKIAGIAATFPHRIVDNDEIVSIIAKHSSDCFESDLQRTLRKVRHLLSHSGIRQRRWATVSETPIKLLARAIHEALEEAGCSLSDIDLLIYSSVGGGFVEPGNSHMIAHALGMKTTQCFDVRDACNGWSRALQLASHMFAGSPGYKRALVVNAEFNATRHGNLAMPDAFKLHRPEELDWCFPAYTIGEAATATVLAADPSNEWEFHFSSRPDLADLCTIPEEGFEGYCDRGLHDGATGHRGSDRIGRNGPGVFTSFGSALFKAFAEDGVAIFKQLRCAVEEIRMVFPHAASKRLWEDAGKVVGSPPMFFIYPEYGNLVTASIPAGIAVAKQQGAINRGDRIAGWVGSAGMSFCSYSFIF